MPDENRYVVLNGGIGNQLWQLSFAHLISKFGPVVLVRIHKSEKSAIQSNAGTDFLMKILQNCNHHIQIETRDFSNISTRAQFIPESRYFINGKRTLDTRRDIGPICENSEFARYFSFLGYYQDVVYLHDYVKTVLDEIIVSIDQQTKFNLSNREIDSFIHIRGGDYLEARHRSIFGVLDSEYYCNVFRYLGRDMGKKNLIITDDEAHAKKVLPNSEIFELLGPNQANEWESFQVMANSKLAVIANSTFSWWAGMITLRRGGRLIAPFPWTKKEKDSGLFTSSIFAEGIERIPSSFIY